MVKLHRRIVLLKSAFDLFGMKRSISTKTKLSNKITVCVEGNIGSGKTTFLKHFQKFDKLVETNGEPVQQWREFGGQNPLASLYTDPNRWAFTFQSLVLLTLIQRHSLPQVKPVRMLERSVYSAKYCFVENLNQSGILSDMEYKVLSQCFDHAINGKDCTVDLIVYLRTSPEICFERIKARNRPEEQIVSLDYLQQLHDLHEAWLLDNERETVIRPPVLTVNGDHDIHTMMEKFYSIQKQLLTYLKQPAYR